MEETREFEYNGRRVLLVSKLENIAKGIYPIQIYVDGKDFGCAPSFENDRDVAIECIH